MSREIGLPTEVVLLRVGCREFRVEQIEVAANIRRLATLFQTTKRIRQVGRLHHNLHCREAKSELANR